MSAGEGPGLQSVEGAPSGRRAPGRRQSAAPGSRQEIRWRRARAGRPLPEAPPVLYPPASSLRVAYSTLVGRQARRTGSRQRRAPGARAVSALSLTGRPRCTRLVEHAFPSGGAKKADVLAGTLDCVGQFLGMGGGRQGGQADLRPDKGVGRTLVVGRQRCARGNWCAPARAVPRPAGAQKAQHAEARVSISRP